MLNSLLCSLSLRMYYKSSEDSAMVGDFLCTRHNCIIDDSELNNAYKNYVRRFQSNSLIGIRVMHRVRPVDLMVYQLNTFFPSLVVHLKLLFNLLLLQVFQVVLMQV